MARIETDDCQFDADAPCLAPSESQAQSSAPASLADRSVSKAKPGAKVDRARFAPPSMTTSSGMDSAKIVFAYLACAAIWGTTWYAIRVCIGPGGFPSYEAAALRFSISSLLLGSIWFALRNRIKSPTSAELKWISVAGLLSGLAYGLLYSAEEQIAGGLAAVISATSPLIAALLAMFFRIENPRRTTIIGSIIAIAGVALVFHDRLQVSVAQASAVGILVFNAFLNSSSNIVMKRHGHDTAALASNTIFFSAASFFLWIGAMVSGKSALTYPLPLAPTLALLYLSFFGTLFAFACFFFLLKHTRLSTAMTLSFVTPLIALVVDGFFEKHGALAPESYLGIGIVLIGVAVSVFVKVREEKTKTVPDAPVAPIEPVAIDSRQEKNKHF